VASFDTLQKLTEHPEWIAPRSDLRVFLGEPGAPEATKVTVEPGNAFSPGMLTFGVTWWVRFPASTHFFAPETAPLAALQWSYEDGYLPLIHCQAQVEGLQISHSLFQDGKAADRSESVRARLRVSNTGTDQTAVQVYLALRSLGPAGGPLEDLMVGQDGSSFWLTERNLPLLGADRTPAAVGCGVGDPSSLARAGAIPTETSVSDPQGWCFGLMRFDLALAPGEMWLVHLQCPQQSYGNLQEELPGTATPQPQAFDASAADVLARWRAMLGHPMSITVPDAAFHDAFFAGLGHMLTALVGDQAHIAPLTYPLPWLRDSVFIIRCFDLAGLHDIARATTDYCARNDFFAGFGAEGDAPGQGIWALVEHYRITRDRAWLASVYPAIQRKCAWLFRLRRTTEPIRVQTDTPVLAYTHAERASGMICLAAKDGLIQGSMDHGITHALGWVNHWALCGLREAAYAAQELGYPSDAADYQAEEAELRTALSAFMRRDPSFFEHERTVNSLLWPTRAWEDQPERIEEGFDAGWRKNRGADDAFIPEPYWLYFEFAQAHNALLLGQRERAWRVIEYRLRHQDVPGLYGWREGGHGVGTRNATRGVTLVPFLRGCQRFDSITPHGWSQSEMWLLQRAVLVEEWQGRLLLFAGVPAHWLRPGARVAFESLPTWYGRVSAQLLLDATGRSAVVTASGMLPGTAVTVRLGQQAEGHADDGGTLTMGLTLP